jgi:hypothetical protein
MTSFTRLALHRRTRHMSASGTPSTMLLMGRTARTRSMLKQGTVPRRTVSVLFTRMQIASNTKASGSVVFTVLPMSFRDRKVGARWICQPLISTPRAAISCNSPCRESQLLTPPGTMASTPTRVMTGQDQGYLRLRPSQ